MEAITDKNGSAYRLDMDRLTVIEIRDRQELDCNPTDEPCETPLGLWYLIRGLWEMRGEFTADTMSALHMQLPTNI